ncbi:MAG TPA: DNA polymerase III subunit delta' [Steroidobacteraceae bacterium]|nr:DNA polymerase III subunit delta' [Steroidobacteraceae bacterium]
MLPWIASDAGSLAAAYAAGRLPHALLIHEAPGAGGDWLALWAAQLVLCLHAERAPCGSCAGCKRVEAGQHPDLLQIRPVEDSRQIRIEQVRELAQDLALTSHGGRYKVGILSPADALNHFAANALLKTLEEPPPSTLLVLVATQPSRLPATILSRCQRVRVRAPTREEALSWLQSATPAGEWETALDILGNAPIAAAQLDPSGVAQIGVEVCSGLDESARGGGDPVTTAEKWARADLPLRLRCFENWITKRIHAHFGTGGPLTEVGAGPYLPGAEAVLNIRELFELLDGVRDLKSALDTPINRGMALESLLRRLAPQRTGSLGTMR